MHPPFFNPHIYDAGKIHVGYWILPGKSLSCKRERKFDTTKIPSYRPIRDALPCSSLHLGTLHFLHFSVSTLVPSWDLWEVPIWIHPKEIIIGLVLRQQYSWSWIISSCMHVWNSYLILLEIRAYLNGIFQCTQGGCYKAQGSGNLGSVSRKAETFPH